MARSKLQELALQRNQALRDLAMIQSNLKHMWGHYPISTVQQSVMLNILTQQKQKVIEIYEIEKQMHRRIENEIDYFNRQIPKMSV